MADVEHKTLGAGEIHLPFQWVFATAADKNALGVGEVGKLCWQQDTNAVFICTAANPIAWVAVGGGGGGGTVTPDMLAGVDVSQADFSHISWDQQTNQNTRQSMPQIPQIDQIPFKGNAFGAGIIHANQYYEQFMVFTSQGQDRLLVGLRLANGDFSIFEITGLVEVAQTQ